jgi:glutamine amidotransferase
MRVALVDYGSGNLRSAAKAFERAARDHLLPAEIVVSGEPAVIANADRIVLPGVGSFIGCMNGLRAVSGLGEALHEAVILRGRPFFGICVGLQLMAARGEEHALHPGLGWIGGTVMRLQPQNRQLKVPHMGWNELLMRQRGHHLFSGIAEGGHAYFVHSYQFVPDEQAVIAACTDYGGQVTAAVLKDNLFGTQFHPEKSQNVGLTLIGNFLSWSP